MSKIIAKMADETARLANELSRIKHVRIEVVQRPITDRATADRRKRLEDPREIAALKKRLGL